VILRIGDFITIQSICIIAIKYKQVINLGFWARWFSGWTLEHIFYGQNCKCWRDTL